jgi:hypothetical protein
MVSARGDANVGRLAFVMHTISVPTVALVSVGAALGADFLPWSQRRAGLRDVRSLRGHATDHDYRRCRRTVWLCSRSRFQGAAAFVIRCRLSSGRTAPVRDADLSPRQDP